MGKDAEKFFPVLFPFADQVEVLRALGLIYSGC